MKCNLDKTKSEELSVVCQKRRKKRRFFSPSEAFFLLYLLLSAGFSRFLSAQIDSSSYMI